MKKIKLILTTCWVLALLVSSCAPDTYSLDGVTDKSDIHYEITQDLAADPGGNTVILKNTTPGVILNWDYGTGKSDKAEVKVQYAFKGNYTIKITAVTGGGLVELDPVTITVAQDNLSYVDDPLWTALSGGVGKSKIWYLDLNAEGVSKFFAGPQFFYGMDNGWLEGGDNGCYGTDCWNWSPEWKGNEWLMPQGDYGSMTFSLSGGALITTDHKMLGKKESGTYFLDTTNKTITLTGATILHDAGKDGCASNWSTNLKILSLTENTMQIGVVRDKCETPALLVYNFISKDYSDNWVPSDTPDPNPEIDLDGGSVGDLLSTTTTSTKTWHLSKDTPFNWTDLEGAFLNNWNSVADYEAAGWTGYVAADQATVVNNKISFSENGTVTTVDSTGKTASGTFTTSTDGTNVITFTGITPTFPIGSSWATVSTTENNQWKIIKTAKTGNVVTDIWFGKRDPAKSEYMVFHFVLSN
ncbi:hypothetical protein [Flavobacterium agrisoli]|uniref:PKD domain-containing protein n=1 Tax=Flavobacterium agrisoli TaxID=2793066 RepID=A0A934PN19_9FLAO|nr:hypothetical protein [Flavobacterium agrisoli]MBK0369418.1 hypothetical protein [Flavobacterium agrisoli]